MNKKQGRKRLAVMLDKVRCEDCGCWEEGFDQQFRDFNEHLMLLAWPLDLAESLGEAPEYEPATFDFKELLECTYDLKLFKLHYSQRMNLLTVSFFADALILHLWVFTIPYRIVAGSLDQMLSDFLQIDLGATGEDESYGTDDDYEDDDYEDDDYRDGNSDFEEVGTEEAGVYAKSLQQKEILERLALATVVDMLVVAGKQANESCIADWSQAQQSSAVDWCRAALRGKGSMQEPAHVKRLDNYG